MAKKLKDGIVALNKKEQAEYAEYEAMQAEKKALEIEKERLLTSKKEKSKMEYKKTHSTLSKEDALKKGDRGRIYLVVKGAMSLAKQNAFEGLTIGIGGEKLDLSERQPKTRKPGSKAGEKGKGWNPSAQLFDRLTHYNERERTYKGKKLIVKPAQIWTLDESSEQFKTILEMAKAAKASVSKLSYDSNVKDFISYLAGLQGVRSAGGTRTANPAASTDFSW